jgi:atypical dual specificity phosphatase
MKIDWVDSSILAAGSIPFSAKDICSLHQQGIRAVLSLTTHPLTISRDITSDLFQELDIIYFHAPIRDHHPPDLPQVHTILNFIAQMKAEERPVLVHCHAGVGRTGTILHTYFLAQGLSLAEAKARVKAGRIQCMLLSERQESFLADFATRYQYQDG